VDAAAQAFGAHLLAAVAQLERQPGSRRRKRPHPPSLIANVKQAASADTPAWARAAGSNSAPVVALAKAADPRIRLLIVDNHPVTRMGLAGFLGKEPGFLVVGEASSGAQAKVMACRCQPDVILMDVRLPDRDSSEVCQEILAEHAEIRVLMLSSLSEPDGLPGSMMAGAAGCILKEDPAEQLVEAVRCVARGARTPDRTVGPMILARTLRKNLVQSGALIAGLAEHQSRLLPLIAEGRTNREIAAQLRLSEHTVKTYVSQILRKLNLRRRAQVASFITRHCTVAS